MIIDGKQIAAEILARTKIRAEKLPHRPKVLVYAPFDTPATRSYLKIKQKYGEQAGCDFEEQADPSFFTRADAAIIQLPLPPGVSNDIIDAVIDIEKDADVLSTAARKKFEQGIEGALLPPVVAAIKEIFDRYKIEPKDKKAVVIGDGWLVGRPAALWLRQQGAQVEVVNSSTTDLAAALHAADIIVSGAGSPHLIKPQMLKEGVVLIDAGTSESGGAIAGDADPACADKCSLFTPVPGGVGPIAVACLFDNAVTLAEGK